MLREELRINGDRMQRLDPHRRPQYTAVERMAILELRAMRGWNKADTSRPFFVSDDTVRAWLRRVDDDSLVQTRTPVNRFPDFVRYAVQQVKLFCPTLEKVKIADMLARAGILDGKTPNEVHFTRSRACEPPRIEPRLHCPRGSSCAQPQVDIQGDPGDPILLEIDCLENHLHLPIIRARHAA